MVLESAEYPSGWRLVDLARRPSKSEVSMLVSVARGPKMFPGDVVSTNKRHDPPPFSKRNKQTKNTGIPHVANKAEKYKIKQTAVLRRTRPDTTCGKHTLCS